MLRIDVTTLIARPVQEVWDFFIDLTNSPRWTRSGSELRRTSPGALGVGATLESVRPMFGREIKSQTIEVTRYAPVALDRGRARQGGGTARAAPRSRGARRAANRTGQPETAHRSTTPSSL